MLDVRMMLAVFLLSNAVVVLVRVARGPTLADRVLVAQLLGTTGVAILLLVRAAREEAGPQKVALLVAVLAPITVVAFIKHAWPRPGRAQ